MAFKSRLQPGAAGGWRLGKNFVWWKAAIAPPVQARLWRRALRSHRAQRRRTARAPYTSISGARSLESRVELIASKANRAQVVRSHQKCCQRYFRHPRRRFNAELGRFLARLLTQCMVVRRAATGPEMSLVIPFRFSMAGNDRRFESRHTPTRRGTRTTTTVSMAFASSAVETLRPMKPVSPATATAPKRRVGSAGASSVKDRTVVVFDWDDTLCPSSWLHAQDLLPKYRGHQISVTPEQRQVLSLIGAQVARLLQKAVAYGPVFVVTAAEYGWVEMSAALYLPAVQSILELADVHIVSARSWYEQTYGLGGDSATWKQEVMQLIARKCFAAAAAQDTSARTFREPTGPQEAYFNFLSIGDSMAERDACFAAVQNVGRTFAKTLKFVEHPNAEEVLQQVELTHDSFEQMCGWDNSLDLRLSRAQLAELRGSPI